jgi:hypothetical protein
MRVKGEQGNIWWFWANIYDQVYPSDKKTGKPAKD